MKPEPEVKTTTGTIEANPLKANIDEAATPPLENTIIATKEVSGVASEVATIVKQDTFKVEKAPKITEKETIKVPALDIVTLAKPLSKVSKPADDDYDDDFD